MVTSLQERLHKKAFLDTPKIECNKRKVTEAKCKSLMNVNRRKHR